MRRLSLRWLVLAAVASLVLLYTYMMLDARPVSQASHVRRQPQPADWPATAVHVALTVCGGPAQLQSVRVLIRSLMLTARSVFSNFGFNRRNF